MKTYNDLPPVFYPQGFKWEAGNSLIVTGESIFSILGGRALEKSGKYEISVEIPKETFLDLKKKKGDDNLPVTGVRKVEKTLLDEDGNEQLSDEGDPIKELSHFQLAMKQNATIKVKGEVKNVEIPIVDANDTSKTYKFIPSGSKVSIKGKLWKTEYKGSPAFGFNLQEVRVWELAEIDGESSSGGGYVDPFAELGLGSVPRKESGSEEASSSNTPQETPEEDIPFDDDIPM